MKGCILDYIPLLFFVNLSGLLEQQDFWGLVFLILMEVFCFLNEISS